MPERVAMFRFLKFAARIPAGALLALIRAYQQVVSPLLPALFGPACGCRFAPSCSHYAAEAVQVHGALQGGWLTLRRLVQCNPLHPGGFDPVPPAVRRTPRCERVVAPPFPSPL